MTAPPVSWADVRELLDPVERLELALDALDREDVERCRFFLFGLLVDLRGVSALVPA